MQESSKRQIRIHPLNPKKQKFRAINFTPMTSPMILSSSRTNGRVFASKRPIDKALINVFKSGVDGTQVTTTLVTATFPCTVVGLRWDLSMLTDGGTTPGSYGWAIVIVRDGVTVSTISLTDGGTFFAPEQDVMAYGSGVLQQIDIGSGHHYNGSTKTMRKLMGGDKLLFLFIGVATQTTLVRGTIQFFCKS